MHTIKNLILVGTSHISLESAKEVEKAILENSPEIIAIELDLKRFRKLFSKNEKINWKNIGRQGFFLNIIGAWVEKYLGKKVGTTPGVEMKKAISLAKKHKIKIALIDQDIQVTLQKLKSRFTFKEKLRFVKNILKSLFNPKKIPFDLRKVPEQKLIKKLTLEVKKDYPSLHRTLIEERDKIMANNLLRLMKEGNKVVAIVGAGHIPGIKKIIKWNLQNKR